MEEKKPDAVPWGLQQAVLPFRRAKLTGSSLSPSPTYFLVKVPDQLAVVNPGSCSGTSSSSGPWTFCNVFLMLQCCTALHRLASKGKSPCVYSLLTLESPRGCLSPELEVPCVAQLPPVQSEHSLWKCGILPHMPATILRSPVVSTRGSPLFSGVFPALKSFPWYILPLKTPLGTV